MSKKEDIIGIIEKIELDDLMRMKDDEKNQLIIRMKHLIKHEKNGRKTWEKNKQIVKIRKQGDYKEYVRESMTRIMMKLSKRLFRLSKEKGNNRGEIQFKQRFQDSLQRKKDNFRKNVKKIIGETKADDLCCSICLQLMISPVMIACGHAFCYQCIDESLIFSKVCPNCRDNIKIPQIIRAGLLDKIIKAKAIAQPNTGQIQYSVRLNRHQQWKRHREVDLKSLKAGFLLDVRDTENIWCQGTVLDVFYQSPKSEIPHAILIHFNQWNKIYNQVIQLPSLRVAPVQFFSSRRDIPYYRLSQQDDNLRGLVVPNRIDNMFQANLIDSESQDNIMDEESSSSLVQIQQAQEQQQDQDENIAPIEQLFNMNIALRAPRLLNMQMQMQRMQMINMLGDIIGRAEAQPLFRYNGERIEDATRRIDQIMNYGEEQFSFQDDLEGYEEEPDQS